MNALELIGLGLGTSFASGLNLYATVAILGLLHRYQFVTLPLGLEVLANPIVLVAAIAMYLVEFVADKIPYVDSVWDVVHTFIRPPAAALLAWGAFAGVGEEWRLAAALVAGSIALTSHGAKASARAAVNASPEPFTNWILSFAEDALAILLAWLATTHPYLTFGLVLILLVLALYVIRLFFRFLRWAAGKARAQAPKPHATVSI